MRQRRDEIIHDESEYLAYFPGKKRASALEVALDVRKFEIDLYWKRAAYFWALIGASFIGFGAAQQLSDKEVGTDLSVVVSCLGTAFSFAWFCINRGSKYWQMNWEKHVDMLEDEKIGPLYRINWLPKSVPERGMRRAASEIKAAFVEAERLSVTRINQLVSLFVCIIWVLLMFHVVPFNLKGSISPLYFGSVTITILFCILFVTWGRSGRARLLTTFRIRPGREIKPVAAPPAAETDE